MMTKKHPTLEQLRAFSGGALAGTEALIISAHCDMCPICADKVLQLTEELAIEDFAQPETLSETLSYSSMLSAITDLPECDQIVAQPTKDVAATIELDGRQFTLPRSLKRYAQSTGNWSKIVGKLWQAPVSIGGVGRANFIYMEKGGSVPEHTHKGRETTLVINGEFSDGISTYGCGDLVSMDQSHTHAPFSDDEEGCLVFSIVDKPLHFTSGVARLLNPFSQLFFK